MNAPLPVGCAAVGEPIVPPPSRTCWTPEPTLWGGEVRPGGRADTTQAQPFTHHSLPVSPTHSLSHSKIRESHQGGEPGRHPA